MPRCHLRSRVSYAVAAIALACCVQPLLSALATPPTVPQRTARIWVYRTFEPSLSRGLATIAVDGRELWLSPNGQAVPIDVPAGRSQIQVHNAAEGAKAKTLSLAPGQVAYAKIVVSDNWLGSDGGQGQHRPTFDIKLEPPASARVDMMRMR